MAAWSTQPRDGRGVRLADLVRRSRSILRADEQSIASWIEVMLDYRESPAAPATGFIEAIAQAGYAANLSRNRGGEDVQEFARMRRALAAAGALAGMEVRELGLRARARDRLLLSTIHGAKGLEFDVVIILEAEDGVMPFFKGQPQEERRTFYVALTRARDRVYCLWSPWRQTRYGRRPNGPSPYLRALGLV